MERQLTVRGKVVAICFGHVASNLGDLAINRGQIALIRSIEPNCNIIVLHFGSDDPELERRFLDSLPVEAVTEVKRISKPRFEIYAGDPIRALADWGISDADIIVGAASEFVFSFGAESNLEKLLTWALPLFAGQAAGKRTLVMPSTYGPFLDPSAASLVRGALSGVATIPVRDARSQEFLNFLGKERTFHALDPAFFVEAGTRNQRSELKRLALIMRPASGGLRDIPGPSRAREIGTEPGLAYEFMGQIIEAFLRRNSANTVVVIAQTQRDEELARIVQETFSEKYGPDRVDLSTPRTVDQYRNELAAVDGVVSSRFHAIVLAVRLGLPVFGAFFGRHGHKIPGLLEMLGRSSYGLDLDQVQLTAEVPTQVLASLDEQVLSSSPGGRVDTLGLRTMQWWADSDHNPTGHGARQSTQSLRVFSELCLRHVAMRSQLFSRQTYTLRIREASLLSELEQRNQEISDLKSKAEHFSRKAYSLGKQLEKFRANYSLKPSVRTRRILTSLKWLPERNLLGLKKLIGQLRGLLLPSVVLPRSSSDRYPGGKLDTTKHRFPEIPPRSVRQRPSASKTVAYVLHNSLPYSRGGYATRAQGLALALNETSYSVHPITRPGFPCDTVPGSRLKKEIVTEDYRGLNYTRISKPLRGSLPRDDYIAQSAHQLEQVFARLQVGLVIGASNHQTSLPALIAARRLGLPFVYEVRGFWEITRKSREPAFGDTNAYAKEVFMEAETARASDLVLTLTTAMKEELISRGVDGNRIHIAPNSVDTERFTVLPQDKALRLELGLEEGVPVIGFIGTFTSYEGLLVLIEAARELRDAGVSFSLMLVGNDNASGDELGPIFLAVSECVHNAGLSNNVVLTGRVAHEEVERYYSLCDILVYPRLSLPVTEMVSPIKPLEAMAMGKAIVVSDVAPLRELVQPGETGMVHVSGSSSSLARELRRLLEDDSLRTRISLGARKWVGTNRSWPTTAARLAVLLDDLLRQGSD